MIVYCVFQEGVYRHECGGVYDSREAAIAAAQAIAADDRDDYHSYDVVAFTLNERPDQSEGEPVLYSVKRSEALARLGGVLLSEAKP